MTLTGLLGSESLTRVDIAAHLDSLRPEARVAECLALSGEHLKRLWEIASAAPGEAQELISDLGPVVFAGRNSLSLLTRFDKCFARQGAAIVGYNRHPLGWLIGPGYFTVTAVPTGLLFDYGRLPGRAPDGWPRVSSNARGLARPVYRGLLDDLVWVAGDVLIGSARRGDLPLDSYFVLARV